MVPGNYLRYPPFDVPDQLLLHRRVGDRVRKRQPRPGGDRDLHGRVQRRAVRQGAGGDPAHPERGEVDGGRAGHGEHVERPVDGADERAKHVRVGDAGDEDPVGACIDVAAGALDGVGDRRVLAEPVGVHSRVDEDLG